MDEDLPDNLAAWRGSGWDIPRLAIEQFERFPLFAVPLINDSASSLRSLMKNAHRFVSIEKDSK